MRTVRLNPGIKAAKSQKQNNEPKDAKTVKLQSRRLVSSEFCLYE